MHDEENQRQKRKTIHFNYYYKIIFLQYYFILLYYMITIKKNPDIKLDIPSFNCDENAVGEHLNAHDLTKFLNVYGFLVIIGRPGFGKTSLAISFITQKKPIIYRKTHHHVIILMPDDSISSLKKNPFAKLDPENIYNELTDSTVSEIYNKIESYSKDDEKTLLFVDYMTA